LENSQIKELLEKAFAGDHIKVGGDGYHYQVEIVSDVFNELSKVKRTQKIYQVLDQHIQSGELHALSIKCFTPLEWEDKKNG